MLLENFTLLYVEDNNDMQHIMKSFLEDEVKALFQAHNGAQGLQYYKNKKPDIILTDFNMPKLNGLEMSRAIKKLDHHQPILLLSALDDIEILKEAINIGINGFVSKPVEEIKILLDLLENIASALQNANDLEVHKIKELKSLAQLRLSASVFTNSQEGILITDKNNCIVDVNPACLKLTGFSKEEVVGNTPTLFSSGVQSPEFYSQMWKALIDMGHWQGELWNRKKSGQVYPERLSISRVLDENGKLQHNVAIFHDITYLKEHEAQLEHIAYNDALTSLPNRLLLHDRMQQALSKARRNKKLFAVCYLDLDGFKPINDAHGHKTGDQVLVEVAQRLQNAVREGDTVSRIGGDEFVLLMLDIDHIGEVQQVLDRILIMVSNAYILSEEIEIKAINSISASIGVTLYPEDESEADLLLRHADQAMYHAKQRGKNCYSFFEPNK
jgi:diguanylate cyclase (GGDEF)-like protein/PAS domain S-box-containing protein